MTIVPDNLFSYFRITEEGIEQKNLLKRESELTPWTNITAYKVKSSMYGYRAAPKSFNEHTVHFLTHGGEEIVVRGMEEVTETLSVLRNKLIAEAGRKIAAGENLTFNPGAVTISLKKNSVEIAEKGNKRTLPVESIGTVTAHSDGIKITGNNNELFFETKKPFYNRDILIEALSAPKQKS